MNILLLGSDARTENESCRTDTMIICSINTRSGEVKLTSILRDVAVEFNNIGQYNGTYRLNAANYFGGPQLGMKTINECFGMNIQYYAMVDFTSFAIIAEKLGGVDICFGGIGINGHLAFNEADASLTCEEFKQLKTRVLPISPETRAANAIGDFGGRLEDMPVWCVTIGFNEIYNARKIRLGIFRDWHRAVARRCGYGEMTADFPVSMVAEHPDALIRMTEFVANLED